MTFMCNNLLLQFPPTVAECQHLAYPHPLYPYYVIRVGGGEGKPNADTLQQKGGWGVDKLLRITVTVTGGPGLERPQIV